MNFCKDTLYIDTEENVNATDDFGSDESVKEVPKTCSDCEHYGICKYEDKLRILYDSIQDRVSGHKFVEDVIIKCKHHKSTLTDNVLNFQPGVRGNTIEDCPSVQLYDYDNTPKSFVGVPLAEPTLHPKFSVTNTDSSNVYKIPSVDAIYNSMSNADTRAIGAIGITDDIGEHKSIKTKILSTSKKVDKPVISGQVIQVNSTTEPVGTAINTDNVPIESINPNDLPEHFRAKVQDNTIREEISGQTTNI